MLKGLLMTFRLLWLVNLASGALYYFQVAVPLKLISMLVLRLRWS